MVASRTLDPLIFLAWSRTLDFTSSIDMLVLATVDRERMICVGEDAFETTGMRILVADRDILAATGQERRRLGQGAGQGKQARYNSDGLCCITNSPSHSYSIPSHLTRQNTTTSSGLGLGFLR